MRMQKKCQLLFSRYEGCLIFDYTLNGLNLDFYIGWASLFVQRQPLKKVQN